MESLRRGWDETPELVGHLGEPPARECAGRCQGEPGSGMGLVARKRPVIKNGGDVTGHIRSVLGAEKHQVSGDIYVLH